MSEHPIHPDYGPCDQMGEMDSCFECLKAVNWYRANYEQKHNELSEAHAREAVLVEALEKKYEDKKNKPMPYAIPKICPSRSHYRERRQGALSGLLIAIDIAKQNTTEKANAMLAVVEAAKAHLNSDPDNKIVWMRDRRWIENALQKLEGGE